MLRLDSTAATFVTPAFSPTKPIIMQAKVGAESVAKIELLMRVDEGADWLPAGLWDLSKEKLFACQPFPFIKLKLLDNTAGERIQVWDSEAEVIATPKPEPIKTEKLPEHVRQAIEERKPMATDPVPGHDEVYRDTISRVDEKKEGARRVFAAPIEEVGPLVSEPYDERPVVDHAELVEG